MTNGYEFVGNRQFSTDTNLSSNRSAWHNFAKHRDMICTLLTAAADSKSADSKTVDSKGASLCVLGAGSCNDLDLETLCQKFATVTLVDLNGALLRESVKARGFGDHPQVRLIEDVDVTGANQLLSEYAKSGDQSLLEEIDKKIETFQVKELGRYDVVASTCLLSQLLNHAFESMGQQGSEIPIDLLVRTRRQHLMMLMNHTNSNASAILITDVTSSETLADLRQLEFQIPDSVWEKIRAGDHLHGMNPIAIEGDIQVLCQQSRTRADVQACRPWVWNATERLYACIGYCMNRKDTDK